MHKLDITNLKKAIITLKESLDYYSKEQDEKIKEMFADSCIQRFEYTYELAWKIMKKYLKLYFNKTEQELTIKNIFRFIKGYGLIDDWTKWSDYNDARNNTSHEYNKNKAYYVLSIIMNFYDDVTIFCSRLEKTINAD